MTDERTGRVKSRSRSHQNESSNFKPKVKTITLYVAHATKIPSANNPYRSKQPSILSVWTLSYFPVTPSTQFILTSLFSILFLTDQIFYRSYVNRQQFRLGSFASLRFDNPHLDLAYSRDIAKTSSNNYFMKQFSSCC